MNSNSSTLLALCTLATLWTLLASRSKLRRPITCGHYLQAHEILFRTTNRLVFEVNRKLVLRKKFLTIARTLYLYVCFNPHLFEPFDDIGCPIRGVAVDFHFRFGRC